MAKKDSATRMLLNLISEQNPGRSSYDDVFDLSEKLTKSILDNTAPESSTFNSQKLGEELSA